MVQELEHRGDVYAFLRGRVQMLDLGEGIVSMLESCEVSRRAVHADWSIAWEGWARLVAQLLNLLAAGRADAVGEAFGCVSETVRRFLFLAESAVMRAWNSRRTGKDWRSWKPRDGSCAKAVYGSGAIVWQTVCFSC